MTDIDIDVETLAQRIADGGQHALVRRLRTAYADAAAAHADLISLDDEQIEAMVQSAAESADGLQWRRALAEVAADELGLSTTEALTNPAVARAQALVGAPSYEQSLAEMIARPVPLAAPQTISSTPAAPAPVPEPPAPEPEPEPEPEPPMPGPSVAYQSVSAADSDLPATDEHQSLAAAEAAATAPDELETVEADDVELALLPEPDPIEYETQAYDVAAAFTEEEEAPFEPEPFSAAAVDEAEQFATAPADAATSAMEIEGSDDDSELVIPAIHQGGVANLPTKREGLSVRLSADGLDILQGEHDIVGRLVWDEIENLEVPHHRSRRRRHELQARLVVRTPHGDASFDVPGVSADDLRDRVEPIVRLYGRH